VRDRKRQCRHLAPAAQYEGTIKSIPKGLLASAVLPVVDPDIDIQGLTFLDTQFDDQR
jgi:hypothetical protein